LSIENVRRAIYNVIWGIIVTIASLFAPIMIKVGPPLYEWLSPWGFELKGNYGEYVFQLIEGKITPLFGYWITLITPIITIIYLLKAKNPNKIIFKFLMLLTIFGPYIGYVYAMTTTPKIMRSLGNNILLLLAVPIWIYLLPMPGTLLFCASILFAKVLATPIGKYRYQFKYIPSIT